jgi:hypothetical protein
VIQGLRLRLGVMLSRLSVRVGGMMVPPTPARAEVGFPRRQLYVVAVVGHSRKGAFHLSHMSVPAVSGELAEHQAREMTVPFHPDFDHWVFSVIPLRRSMVGSQMCFSNEESFVHEEVNGEPVIFEEED